MLIEKKKEMADWERSSQRTRCGQQSSNYHCCSREACWILIAVKPAPQVSPSSDVTHPFNKFFAIGSCLPVEILLLPRGSERLKFTGWGKKSRELASSWGWCCVNWELLVNDVLWCTMMKFELVYALNPCFVFIYFMLSFLELNEQYSVVSTHNAIIINRKHNTTCCMNDSVCKF